MSLSSLLVINENVPYINPLFENDTWTVSYTFLFENSKRLHMSFICMHFFFRLSVNFYFVVTFYYSTFFIILENETYTNHLAK